LDCYKPIYKGLVNAFDDDDDDDDDDEQAAAAANNNKEYWCMIERMGLYAVP